MGVSAVLSIAVAVALPGYQLCLIGFGGVLSRSRSTGC